MKWFINSSLLLTLLLATFSFSFGQASLGITKTADVSSTVMPGEQFQYIIQYTCISITEDCVNATIVDVLPAGLNWSSSAVQIIPSVHVANAAYNQTNHTVTVNMISPLEAGSTGEIRLTVHVASDATDGMVITNTATFDADNAPPVSDDATVTVSNPPILQSLTIDKTDPSVHIDQNSTYIVLVCNEVNGSNHSNITIVDTLPPGSQFFSASGGGTYNSSNHTVTWTPSEILPGNCFDEEVVVTFPNANFTPGSCVTNTATFTATPEGGSQYSDSDSENACFPLPPQVTISKVGPQIMLDMNADYMITVCNPASGEVVTNVVITDQIPSGSQFVSASNGGTFNNGTVTWNIGTLNLGQCTDVTLTVFYPSSNFNPGQCITNVGNVTANPSSGAPYTRSNGAISCFATVTPEYGANFFKEPDGGTYNIGDDVYWKLLIHNSGLNNLAPFVVTDDIPFEVEVTEFRFSQMDNTIPGVNVLLEYQTNLNAFWQNGGNYNTNPAQTVDVSTFGFGAGEYISKIRLTFDSIPPNWRTITLGFVSTILPNRWVDGSTAPGTTVEPGTTILNVATATSPNITNLVDSGQVQVADPASSVAEPYILKEFVGQTQIAPGGMTGVTLNVANHSSADLNYEGPFVVSDLLPASLKYVEGSQNAPAGTTFEAIEDYNGTGRTLLIWTSPASTSIAPGSLLGAYVITFDVMAKQGIPAGTIQNYANVSNSPTNAMCFTGSTTDTLDADNDGSTTDEVCTDDATLTILTVAAMESIKWVKGQLDADYNRYPDVGETVAGGLADYRLIVKNVGSVPMTDVVVIDILPWVGDVGVLDPSARESEWRPNLVGPVSVSDPAISVLYSTANNPCRTELDYTPAGCTTANWNITPPSDITSIQSLKFDFNNIVVAPGDSLVLEWPMRAPLSAPADGKVAWNSFGFVATRADNGNQLLASEPIKVGIAITQPPQPIVIGDYVWFDENCNGIQDAGETGVNGVRVDVFEDDGDGIPEPNGDDTFIAFTVTGNDFFGNPGFYLFSSLPAGSYFLQFTTPSGSNYIFSPQMSGTNTALDSDANSNGITPVVTYPPGSDTRDVDLGLCDANTPKIDLELTKVVDNNMPPLGSNVTFTVTVVNNSAVTATGVAVTDVLPASLQYVNHSGGNYNPSSGVWTIGTLNPNQTVSLTITVTTTQIGDETNCAEVSNADQNDADSIPNDGQGDDYDCADITVKEPLIDIKVNKTADRLVVLPGETVAFTITVMNESTSTATDLIILDQLPAGVTYVSDNSGGSYDPVSGLWTIGTLPGGETRTLVIQVTIN